MGFNQTLLVKGGTGASKFTDLTDTFPNYTGKAGQVITVKGDETGLTSVPMSGASFDKLSVYLGAAFSSVAGIWQKVPLDTVSYDTGGIWDATNKRIQPKKAGYYQVTGRVTSTASKKELQISLNASGPNSIAIGGNPTPSGIQTVAGIGMVYCNGTTDYFELFVYDGSIGTYTTGSFETYLQVLGPF